MRVLVKKIFVSSRWRFDRVEEPTEGMGAIRLKTRVKLRY